MRFISYGCMIVAVTKEPLDRWQCVGRDRDQAMFRRRDMLRQGFKQPLYFLILTPKARAG
jgi:hypothetical protein